MLALPNSDDVTCLCSALCCHDGRLQNAYAFCFSSAYIDALKYGRGREIHEQLDAFIVIKYPWSCLVYETKLAIVYALHLCVRHLSINTLQKNTGTPLSVDVVGIVNAFRLQTGDLK